MGICCCLLEPRTDSQQPEVLLIARVYCGQSGVGHTDLGGRLLPASRLAWSSPQKTKPNSPEVLFWKIKVHGNLETLS